MSAQMETIINVSWRSTTS